MLVIITYHDNHGLIELARSCSHNWQPVQSARSAVNAHCFTNVQLMMPAETARDTIAALGQAGQLQFKDLCEDKSPLQRTFANQVLSLLRSLPLAGSVIRIVVINAESPLQP